MEDQAPKSTIIRIIGLFQEVSFQHIFIEMNKMVDQLSKDGVQLGESIRHKWEMTNDTLVELDPEPFMG